MCDAKLSPGDTIPATNYMFKVKNRNTRIRCETCSKLSIQTPSERRQWRQFGSICNLSRSVMKTSARFPKHILKHGKVVPKRFKLRFSSNKSKCNPEDKLYKFSTINFIKPTKLFKGILKYHCLEKFKKLLHKHY